jgi:gamma-glutamyl-gamma-aminobutyrate hydrolase PuuD
MIKIGITQRVETVPTYNERRDCLDQQWITLLEKSGIMPVPVPNCLRSPEVFVRELSLEGFILSGGNDLSILDDARNPSQERDFTENRIIDFAKEHNLPLLGVCRGFQALNVYLNGKLSRIAGHAGSAHTVTLENSPYYKTTEISHEVNSYHTLGIYPEELSPSLQSMAVAGEGTIEAAYHPTLPWVGIMWHPERGNINDPLNEVLIRKLFLLPNTNR